MERPVIHYPDVYNGRKDEQKPYKKEMRKKDELQK
jgi:hypothetical protein